LRIEIHADISNKFISLGNLLSSFFIPKKIFSFETEKEKEKNKPKIEKEKISKK